MTKISVIIPMYNVEKYLRRCLDSVKNQTFQDWQAICIDDGSPDKSGVIAEEYAQKDKRFIVLHKENGGLSDARNYGLNVADGKYVMYLDSDDCIHPQTMELLHDLAEENDVDVVTFDFNHDVYKREIVDSQPCDKMPEFFNKRIDKAKIKYKKTNSLIKYATNRSKSKWYTVSACMVWKCLYRREFFQDIRFCKDIKIMEDFIYWSMVLARRPRALVTSLEPYYYAINPGFLLHTTQVKKTVSDIINGILYVAPEYKNTSYKSDARIWYKRFMWDFLGRVYNGLAKMNTDDKVIFARIFDKLKIDGVINNAPDFHARRYKRRILNFIKKYNK